MEAMIVTFKQPETADPPKFLGPLHASHFQTKRTPSPAHSTHSSDSESDLQQTKLTPQMQPDVETTVNTRLRQTKPLCTSGFTLDGNRRNLIFTGTPPRGQVIWLQDEHEAEATGPVDETPDETPETYNKELEWEMEEFLLYKKKKP